MLSMTGRNTTIDSWLSPAGGPAGGMQNILPTSHAIQPNARGRSSGTFQGGGGWAPIHYDSGMRIASMSFVKTKRFHVAMRQADVFPAS